MLSSSWSMKAGQTREASSSTSWMFPVLQLVPLISLTLITTLLQSHGDLPRTMADLPSRDMLLKRRILTMLVAGSLQSTMLLPMFSLRECQGCLRATGMSSECLLSMPRAEVLQQPQMKPCPRHSLMFQENQADHLLLMLTKTSSKSAGNHPPTMVDLKLLDMMWREEIFLEADGSRSLTSRSVAQTTETPRLRRVTSMSTRSGLTMLLVLALTLTHLFPSQQDP